MAAVQAAFEETSRTWPSNKPKPLVLAQAPALSELLRNPTIRLMSVSFLFFPEQQKAVDTVLQHARVDYIIDYNHPMTPDYQRAIRRATPIFSRTGTFLDRGINYFRDTALHIDTLILYEVPQQR